MKMAAVCVVKNAGFRIAEWIAYHLALGFDTIILVDNASTDDTTNVITVYSKFYDVRIISWPMTGPHYQKRGFEYAVWSVRQEFDWCACIDADEFVVPPEGQSLKDAFINRGSDISAIAMPWSMFGSAGLIKSPKELVISSYLYRAVETFSTNQHIKSFVRPEAVRECVTPHFFLVDGNYSDMRGALIEVPSSITNKTLPFEFGRINHYFVQSYEDWKRKISRGYHDIVRFDEQFQIYDRNEVFDNSACLNEKATVSIMRSVERYFSVSANCS